MLCSRVELVVVCLVLLSQSIGSAPSNPSQVSKSSQHENLHQNEETGDGMFPNPRDDEEATRSPAGSFEQLQENRKAHPGAGGSVVSRTGPGGSLVSSDSSSTSTSRETTEPFSTLSSRKSLSGTTPTDSKSHSQDNISEDHIGVVDTGRNNEFSSAAEDSPNKSETSSSGPRPSFRIHSSSIIKDKRITAGDSDFDSDDSGQNTEKEESTSSSTETFKKNTSPSPVAHLHRISLNRSNLLPPVFLLPPPPLPFIEPSESQQYHSEENEKEKDSHSGVIFAGAESNEKEGDSDSDPSNNTNIKCSPFSTSPACSSNSSSSSSEENPSKQEEVDVILIPGAGFRPPTILIIDTITTETNSTESSSGETEDNENYSEENGSSSTTDASTTTLGSNSFTTEESSENVSPEIVEELNSTHDAINGTIPHDSRLNDKKGSPERDEMSGLHPHPRPWFINHEPKHSNGSRSHFTLSTTSPDSNSTPSSSISGEQPTHSTFSSNSPLSSQSDEKVPILPASHSSDGHLQLPLSPPDSDEPTKKSTENDESIGNGGNEKDGKPQTSSPIVSRSKGPLNRRRRDSIFSHLSNNSSRSQSVTHSAKNNSSISSQESNNSGNSTPASASIESNEMDSNGNATTAKDTIHIFLEILHLEPISSDESQSESKENRRNSSRTNPHPSSSEAGSSKASSADNSASDGSLDSTSNQNSSNSTSHRISRRESHSVAPTVSVSSQGPSTGGAGGATAGKSNPSPSPATSTHSPPQSTPSQAKQSPPSAAGKPTSTAPNTKPITSNKTSFDLPPLLNVQQH